MMGFASLHPSYGLLASGMMADKSGGVRKSTPTLYFSLQKGMDCGGRAVVGWV
jgi:hypothetical protein